MRKEYDVFISYSSKEENEAACVRDVLTQNGLSCWKAPESIPGGSSYLKEIAQAIHSSKAVVFMLSSNSQNSYWVLAEVLEAINCGKVIIPFAIEDCNMTDEFNFMLSKVQRIEAYNKKAEALERLVKTVKSIINADIDTDVAVDGTDIWENPGHNSDDDNSKTEINLKGAKGVIAIAAAMAAPGLLPAGLLAAATAYIWKKNRANAEKEQMEAEEGDFVQEPAGRATT